MKNLMAALGLAAALVLTGCMSGSEYAGLKSDLPEIAAGKGRIYFYRERRLWGSVWFAPVTVDGSEVGQSQPGSVFFVDVEPGHHVVATHTYVTPMLDVVVPAGQARYVKTAVGWERVLAKLDMELVDPRTAKREIQDLSYTGRVGLVRR